MAIKRQAKTNLNSLAIISKHDESVDLDKSNWDEYQKKLDPAHLVFKEGMQPTRFLCNFELKGKEAVTIKNAIFGGSDEDGKPLVTMGTWSYRVVKLTLKDIQNPEDLPLHEQVTMRKDDRGLAHDDLIGELDRYGIVDEIFGHYSRLILTSGKEQGKNS